jgi:hypothetical protein
VLVQPGVVPCGRESFPVRAGGMFNERGGRRRESVREVEPACPPFVALSRDTVMVAASRAAMFLTAVAERGVVSFEVPGIPVGRVKEIEEEAVLRASGQVRVRVVSSDEAREVVDEALAVKGVVPIEFVNRDSVLQPQKAVYVSFTAESVKGDVVEEDGVTGATGLPFETIPKVQHACVVFHVEVLKNGVQEVAMFRGEVGSNDVRIGGDVVKANLGGLGGGEPGREWVVWHQFV